VTLYSPDFYDRHQQGMRASAREIVPIVIDLVGPSSVIDVGCGIGTWLSVFREIGVKDILGIDGAWVDKSRLEIPIEVFLSADLGTPMRLNRKFDLVVSLEVGEHLPPDRAAGFVNFLTSLGPAILFSAAIPFQGGKNHVNEQWPEYWRDLFQARDYVAIDAVRKRIWNNENVEAWYKQNILLFVHNSHLSDYPSLKKELEQTHESQLSLVHPRTYLDLNDWNRRLHLMARDIGALLKPDDAFILVDEDQFREIIAAGRRVWPFLEKDGQYWGSPADDATAIRELERMRGSRISHIVFAWPAFWRLEHYPGFHNYLRTEFQCALENERIVAFDVSR
jgi:SAM-dependent methyltransferase